MYSLEDASALYQLCDSLADIFHDISEEEDWPKITNDCYLMFKTIKNDRCDDLLSII